LHPEAAMRLRTINDVSENLFPRIEVANQTGLMV